jgi:hypothetical protein
MIVRRALVAIESIWNLHVIFLQYTEIFYIIYSVNVPSFQCEMSLDRSKSTGELGGLCLIFNDPPLTLWLHWSETELQLSENIDVFSVSSAYKCVIYKEG